MRKFIIERPLPGIGAAERAELESIARTANTMLRELRPHVQWVRSFVGADKTFCVYIADSEEVLRRYIDVTGFPADTVTEIRSVIDPASAEP